MAFYSTDEYLAAEARKNSLRVRGKTPPLQVGVVHPPEHERQRMQNLLDSIPETQPGPNAFAQQAEMTERKKVERRVAPPRELEPRDERVVFPQQARTGRREGNASSMPSLKSQLATNPVYQAELARRRATPPTDIHPALRKRSVSSPPSPPRDSACTNITDFIKAGMGDSPKLKLNATPNPSSVPTFRGRVEERTEQFEHDRSGSDEEKVPVFHPTPKMTASKDFAQRPGTPANALQKDEGAYKAQIKTPKKSLFQKFKLSTNSRSANASAASDMPADPADQADEKVPVKAQAVLGETPKKHRSRLSIGSLTQIPRSPSKRKNFFSRKNVENTEPARPPTALQLQRPPNTPSTVVSDEPQMAISDPTHFSYHDRHLTLKHQSEEAGQKEVFQRAPTVARSQSVNLKYLDGRIPPTPPAKNTPPHEKAAKELKEVAEMRAAMIMPERQRLLEDDEGIVSNTDRISPTKYGNYGYRDAPTLVTQKSMMSMHASVVPDMMEATTIEEMEARVGGLDLEGFSSPTDKIVRRSNIQPAVYSPSMYSPEMATMSRFANQGLRAEESRLSNVPSTHTKDSSSNGTIPIIYPDLANDPNVVHRANRDANQNVNGSPVNRGRTHLSPELTWHGRTHSRDHLDNDRQSLFAHHVDNQDHRPAMVNSPSSFSHMSAMPSPLQYLPATTYTSPVKKGKKKAVQTDADMSQMTPSQNSGSKSTRGSGLGIQAGEASVANSSKRDSGLFQIEPTRTSTKRSMTNQVPQSQRAADTTTAQTAAQQSVFELPAPANPNQRKQAASLLGVSGDKLDLVLEMLNKRNENLHDMRNELRASTARIDQRLSAFESQHRASPTPASSPMGYSQDEVDAWAKTQGKRNSTDVAHNFYRSAMTNEAQQGAEPIEAARMSGIPRSAGSEFGGGHAEGVEVGAQESEGEGEGAEEVKGESETIKELTQTNKKLLELVGGLAGKIEMLEEKMKRDSG